MKFAKPSNAGSSSVPISSLTAPNAAPILNVLVVVAAAVPPTCVSIAFSSVSCASSISPLFTSVAIFSFSTSVKVTPERLSAVMPLIGSCKALPSCTAFISAAPKPAAARSIAAVVARSNAPPTTSASCPMFLNVISFACVALIVSAVTPSSNSCASASFCKRSVTTAVSAPNRFIDFATAARRSSACFANSAPCTSFVAAKPTAAAPADAAAKPTAAFLPNALIFEPRP